MKIIKNCIQCLSLIHIFLDKDFDVVDECSLNDYINVDFAKLTEVENVTQENNEEVPRRVHSLLKVKKAGVKPDIRKEGQEQA